MATTDSRPVDGQADALAFGRGCEAPDLKRILTTIADQISDADKRHTEALSAMQQRLAALGQEAKAVREHAPEAMVAQLDNIEEQMAVLADKITEADDGRRTPSAFGVFALSRGGARGVRASLRLRPLPAAAPDAVERAVLKAHQGLVGNTDQGGRRQVTLIEQEVWQVLMAQVGATLPPATRPYRAP